MYFFQKRLLQKGRVRSEMSEDPTEKCLEVNASVTNCNFLVQIEVMPLNNNKKKSF